MVLDMKGKRKNKLYQGEREKASEEAISAIVSQMAEEMRGQAENAGRVSLRDTDTVKELSIRYLDVCAECGTLPSVRGLGAAMGMTRGALYEFCRTHPGHETSVWLAEFDEVCAESTMAAAMGNFINPITAIFITKARHNWRDTISVEAKVPESPLGAPADVEAIAEKYRFLPED